MHKRMIVLVLCIALVSTILIVALNLHRSVAVDNTTPVEQLVTEDHGLMKLMLAKEVFYVRKGFEEVTAKDLAKYCDLTLECKRQVSDTEFYYVIMGDGYRCFIMTDNEDVVYQVLLTREFASIEEIKEVISVCAEYNFFLADANIREYSPDHFWRITGGGSFAWEYVLILQDGVLAWKEPFHDPSGAEYHFYSDDEWKDVYKQWHGFVILPIDKQ